MPLLLSFPERAAPPKDLEIRPKHVKAWIESLPLAQTFDSSRRLAEHLGAVNRSRVDLDERVQILEIYRPVAGVLLEDLDDLYAKAPLPLGTRARDALGLARALAVELAAGYKIAIVEKAGKRIAFGLKKQLPPLVLRALEYLAAQLRVSYKSYTPVPAGVWKEMHQLYLYAEEEGFAGEAADTESKATILEAYCESLLVSLTDPYRLAQGDVERIVAQVRAMRVPLALAREAPATRNTAHFLVPCDTDRGPKPALSDDGEPPGPNARLLDASPLVDKLRARKQAIDSGNVSATMTRMMSAADLQLVASLVALWGDPPRRAYRRENADSTVAICVGMKAIGHFVALDASAAQSEEESLRTGITVPQLVVPEGDPARTIPIFEWAVVNQSEGGLKVRRTLSTQQPIAVGEAVGIKSMGNPLWKVGVTRWLTLLDDGGMEFGLQFFAPAACAVWVQPTLSANPQAKLGLLLVDEEEGSSGELLMTPPNTYEELREFELRGDGLESRVRAAALIEKTARFELFHVSPS